MKTFLAITVFTFLSFPAPSHGDVVNRNADGLTSTLNKTDSDPEKPVYKGTYSVSVNGNTAVQKNTINDLEGKTVATEELVEVDGSFSKYGYQRIEAGEGGEIVLKGKTLHFSYTKDGETSTKEMELPERFVVGPGLTSYARANWDKVMNGEELHIKYGVLDRKDIYRFKIFKDRVEKRGDEEVVVLKFKPATFFVSLLVDPIFITFSKDGAKVYEVLGRTFLLEKSGDGWEPLNAHTIYHHDAR